MGCSSLLGSYLHSEGKLQHARALHVGMRAAPGKVAVEHPLP